ncbi:MAG: hypothetical protein QOH26_905 [Actinomycetota bacterium]|nr:hypothetical protein [Actinomycetota bacterium]
MSRRVASRAAIYSVVGFAFEVAVSAVHDVWRGKDVRFRTSPWMFPIYALIAPMYEPIHDALRERPWPIRATTYGFGFLAVEYVTGAGLSAWRGEAPWDYSDARWHVHGLIRPDYLFQWAVAGILLEPLHDRLIRN